MLQGSFCRTHGSVKDSVNTVVRSTLPKGGCWRLLCWFQFVGFFHMFILQKEQSYLKYFVLSMPTVGSMQRVVCHSLVLSVKGEVIVWTFRQDFTLKSMLWLCGYKWIAVACFTWSWIRINSQQVQYNAKMLSVEKKRFQALCPRHNLFTYISHSVHKCTDSLHLCVTHNWCV